MNRPVDIVIMVAAWLFVCFAVSFAVTASVWMPPLAAKLKGWRCRWALAREERRKAILEADEALSREIRSVFQRHPKETPLDKLTSRIEALEANHALWTDKKLDEWLMASNATFNQNHSDISRLCYEIKKLTSRMGEESVRVNTEIGNIKALSGRWTDDKIDEAVVKLTLELDTIKSILGQIGSGMNAIAGINKKHIYSTPGWDACPNNHDVGKYGPRKA